LPDWLGLEPEATRPHHSFVNPQLADRINQQNDELERLMKERDDRLK
jgi:hypothetical protein